MLEAASVAGRRKRIGTVILWVSGFVLLAVDYSDELQRATSIVPAGLKPYMPAIYGTLLVGALLLLHFAHKDDLEALEEQYSARLPNLVRIERADGDEDIAVNDDDDTYTVTSLYALVEVRVSGTVQDVRVRIESVNPDPQHVRWPLYVQPHNRQPQYHAGDRVVFRVAQMGDDPPRLFIAGEEIFGYSEEQVIEISATASGSAPDTRRFALSTLGDVLRLDLLSEASASSARA